MQVVIHLSNLISLLVILLKVMLDNLESSAFRLLLNLPNGPTGLLLLLLHLLQALLSRGMDIQLLVFSRQSADQVGGPWHHCLDCLTTSDGLRWQSMALMMLFHGQPLRAEGRVSLV